MNWLQKLLCRHQWKKEYSHASLSMFNQSGRIEMGEKCIFCDKSRARAITYDDNGIVVEEHIRYIKNGS